MATVNRLVANILQNKIYFENNILKNVSNQQLTEPLTSIVGKKNTMEVNGYHQLFDSNILQNKIFLRWHLKNGSQWLPSTFRPFKITYFVFNRRNKVL